MCFVLPYMPCIYAWIIYAWPWKNHFYLLWSTLSCCLYKMCYINKAPFYYCYYYQYYYSQLITRHLFAKKSTIKHCMKLYSYLEKNVCKLREYSQCAQTHGPRPLWFLHLWHSGLPLRYRVITREVSGLFVIRNNASPLQCTTHLSNRRICAVPRIAAEFAAFATRDKNIRAAAQLARDRRSRSELCPNGAPWETGWLPPLLPPRETTQAKPTESLIWADDRTERSPFSHADRLPAFRRLLPRHPTRPCVFHRATMQVCELGHDYSANFKRNRELTIQSRSMGLLQLNIRQNTARHSEPHPPWGLFSLTELLSLKKKGIQKHLFLVQYIMYRDTTFSIWP